MICLFALMIHCHARLVFYIFSLFGPSVDDYQSLD